MATTLKGTIRGGGRVTFSATPATVSIPTGSVDLQLNKQTIDFTVPIGISVLKTDLNGNGSRIGYIGVTPGSVHKIKFNGGFNPAQVLYRCGIFCSTHNKTYLLLSVASNIDNMSYVRISWSPEINTHKPDVISW